MASKPQHSDSKFQAGHEKADVPMDDDQAVLRIGEVSRRTGVSVATLRAWERRYGLLDPHRTDGGHRLYREADVDRVRMMSRLLDDGWSAGAAAREVLREPAEVVPLRSVPTSGASSNLDAAQEFIVQLEAALDNFDAARADDVVDDIFVRLQVPRALDEVVLPMLRRVGDGWQDDPRVIAREHFASNTLRPRLQRLLRANVPSSAPSLLAAAPEGETHDLGLLAASAVAVDSGWRVHYLGADTPTAAIEQSAAQLQPVVVLIGATFREHAESFLSDRPAFPCRGVVLGGPGFAAGDTGRLAGAVVHQGPMRDLAQSLQRAARGASGVG